MQCQSCGGPTELTGKAYLPDGRVVCRPCAEPRPLVQPASKGTSTRDLLLIVLALLVGIAGVTFALSRDSGPSKDPSVVAARDQIEVTMYFTTW